MADKIEQECLQEHIPETLKLMEPDKDVPSKLLNLLHIIKCTIVDIEHLLELCEGNKQFMCQIHLIIVHVRQQKTHKESHI